MSQNVNCSKHTDKFWLSVTSQCKTQCVARERCDLTEQTEAVEIHSPWTEEKPDWIISGQGDIVAPFKPNLRACITTITPSATVEVIWNHTAHHAGWSLYSDRNLSDFLVWKELHLICQCGQKNENLRIGLIGIRFSCSLNEAIEAPVSEETLFRLSDFISLLLFFIDF